MRAAVVVGQRIDRRVTLDQDEAGASRIEEGDVPARHGGQVPAADDLPVEPRASRDVTHRETEMDDALDRNRVALPSPLVRCSNH